MNCPFFTALSPITGRGLFANRYFPAGSLLLKVYETSGKSTQMGRLIGRAPAFGTISLRSGSNIRLQHYPDGVYAIAKLPIFQGRELLI